MTFLTDEGRERIAQAIAAAEAKTSGELVAVVARHAGKDDGPLLWPALIALILPAGWLTIAPGAAAWTVYLAQIGLFLALALILQVVPLRQALLPRPLRRWRARQLAEDQFRALRLDQTREHTGVLIFVSIAEHHVEIIADTGINAVVPPGTWDQAVAAFVAEVRAGRVVEGFLAA